MQGNNYPLSYPNTFSHHTQPQPQPQPQQQQQQQPGPSSSSHIDLGSTSTSTTSKDKDGNNEGKKRRSYKAWYVSSLLSRRNLICWEAVGKGEEKPGANERGMDEQRLS